MWWLIHQWSFLLFWLSVDCFWLFLTTGAPFVHCWYSLDRPVTIGTPMVLSVFHDWYSVRIVKYSQKTVKQPKNNHCCTNRHMSTQSPPNTQSRANAATSRDLHHMCLGSGHSMSPVDRADSMCLHGRPCVWLPFAAVYAATPFSTCWWCLQSVNDRHQIPYFRTTLANFLLSRPNSVENCNSKTTTLLH